MRNLFVPVSNVARFSRAIAELDTRGAPEKQIVVVHGAAGLGKSRTGSWWQVQNDALALSIKPGAGPAWVLSDLVRLLGLPPKRLTKDLWEQCIDKLAREQQPIIVDEVENALDRDAKALDMLRAAADTAGLALVLIGREHTAEKLRRHPQIWTRVVSTVEFQPLTQADVRLLADELLDGRLADDLVAEIRNRAAGVPREALRLLAHCEKKLGQAGIAELALAQVADLPAVDGRRRAAIVPGPGQARRAAANGGARAAAG